MSDEPKYKLHQWVFSLKDVRCFKIWGIRYIKGDGIKRPEGWYYYSRDDEYSEYHVTADFEELEKYVMGNLKEQLNSAFFYHERDERWKLKL